MSSSKDSIDLNSLSEDDKNMFLSERINKFKLTIMICVLYGLIAGIMLIIAFFTSWGKKFLYEEMMAFVVTFIIGTVLIIVYLANEVYSFKPLINKAALGYDADTCPDYWKLKIVDENGYENRLDNQNRPFFNSQVNKNQFKYKCEADERLFDKDELKNKNEYSTFNNNQNGLYKPVIDSNNTKLKGDDIKNFKQYSANMIGYTYDITQDSLSINNSNAMLDYNGQPFSTPSSIPVPCDVIYPVYFAVMDKQNQEKNPDEPNNKYRCAYAKACNVNWTDAGCEL
jgi:hypothetical protein